MTRFGQLSPSTVAKGVTVPVRNKLNVGDKAIGTLNWSPVENFGFLRIICLIDKMNREERIFGDYEPVIVRREEIHPRLHCFLDNPEAVFQFRIILASGGQLEAKITSTRLR